MAQTRGNRSEGELETNGKRRRYERALAAAAGECSVCWHIIWHLWFKEGEKPKEK